MQAVQSHINFNEDTLDGVYLYELDSIGEIPEGTLFGIVATTYDMEIIYPKAEVVEGYLTFYLENKCDEFNPSAQSGSPEFKSVIDEKKDNNSYYDGDDMLLMVRKLKGNLVQEVLSGEVFALKGTEKDDDNYNTEDDVNDIDVFLPMERYQQVVSKYSDICVRLDSRATNGFDGKNIDGVYIEVDDAFKEAYTEHTLPNKDKIVDVLKECKKHAKKVFDKEYEKSIQVSQTVAISDNFIYDLENSNSEAKPKSR